LELFKKVVSKNFFIRLRSWEYWPFGIVQFPLFIYWMWLSLRARSMLFFSASNPSILMGGMFGESKYDILKQVPGTHIPKTVYIEMPSSPELVIQLMEQEALSFPVIFKPDIGERGHMVKRINSRSDVTTYINQVKGNFIIQELVDLPVECSVFYVRYPGEERGRITSVVLKEMLRVTGDGRSTVRELIMKYPRAKLQWSRLQEMHTNRLDDVLAYEEVFELNSIGNHCLGTTFLNGNHLINELMIDAFDAIGKQMDEFYYGRFDLRCASIESLYKGNVKILEVNGCGAEPAHIYHPGFSLFEALRILFNHWNYLFEISSRNKERGYSYLPLWEGIKAYRNFKKHMVK
jgi:hypothetical protein